MRIAILYPVVEEPRAREDLTILTSVDALIKGLHEHRVNVKAYPISCSRDSKGQLSFDCNANLQISSLLERAESFQIIHNHCGFFPLACSSLISTPIITTLYNSPRREYCSRFTERSLFIGVSDKLRGTLIPMEKIIYPGLPFHRHFFNENPDRYFVSSFCISKKTGILRATEAIDKSGEELLVYGDAAEKKIFDTEIKPELRSKLIYFRQITDDNHRMSILSGAKAMLALTEEEPLEALEVVESMSCGTPVIASRSGCLPELIDHNRTGFLINADEDILKGMEEAILFERGRCWSYAAERFSAKRMVDDYISLFREVDRTHRREGSRPWGFYSILADETDHKVKRIVVLPGARLSLQRHSRREEHWFIHSGQARITIENNTVELTANQSIDIPRGGIHRIENTGDRDLIFFEVQTGDYFGEDDIERLEDDFGRD